VLSIGRRSLLTLPTVGFAVRRNHQHGLAGAGAHAAICDVQQTAALKGSRDPYGLAVWVDGVMAWVVLAELQHLALQVSERFHGWWAG
jgi:hypothetical protein